MDITKTQQTDEQFRAWLGGLIDGEGCFTIATNRGVHRAMLTLALRADDWHVLDYIRRRTGLGTLLVKRSQGNPMASWSVMRIDDCLVLDEVICGTLLSKKKRDHAIWSLAVHIIDEYGGGLGPMNARLAELKTEMHALKPFSQALFGGVGGSTGQLGNGDVSGANPRIGRSSSDFWESEASRPHRQWRQARYAKLSQPDIDTIVARIASGDRRKDVAADFGVSAGLLSRFVTGNYMRRDGSLAQEAHVDTPKATSPDFWTSEAGLRAKKRMALSRGKLSQVQIDELVARHGSGETIHSLARAYGISRPLVKKFIDGNYIRKD